VIVRKAAWIYEQVAPGLKKEQNRAGRKEDLRKREVIEHCISFDREARVEVGTLTSSARP